MSPDGCFLVEDVHTSYWDNYGGGHQRPGTFMEYAKDLTDQLNAWHSRSEDLVVDDFTRTTDSMHFWDSIVVLERREREQPVARKRGVAEFNIHDGTGPAEQLGGAPPS